ncbi:MAG TPA: DUF2231 domain-containing protein [Dongiaceae bacterium]|nr:DUF2231 domain-containing protein [Dongiaceae bacterium]
MLSLEHVHPMLVHFPIVFFLTLAVVDTIATLRGAPVTGRTGLGHASTGLAVLAALFAIASFMFGDMALEFAESKGFASDTAELHEHLGMASAAAFTVWAVVRLVTWWRNATWRGGGAFGLVLVELAGAVLIMTTAYYGGQLVYDLGVNVKQAMAG